MNEEFRDDVTPPLPPGWLPDAQPPEGDPHWDRIVTRILGAARPELEHVALGSIAAGMPSTGGAGLWWRSAAALAVASAAALIVMGRGDASVAREGSMPLELVAADGDPVALWRARGIAAHPVLALIAVQDPEPASERDTDSGMEREEEGR